MSSVAGKGDTSVTQNTKNKGEASPPTLKRVEASPKNGQQGKVTQPREISEKAKIIMASLPIKHLPFQPERWKQGDPDPEPDPEEERALLAIVNGAEVIPMPKPKPKPPPIMLEAAMVENRSIFPNATGNPSRAVIQRCRTFFDGRRQHRTPRRDD